MCGDRPHLSPPAPPPPPPFLAVPSVDGHCSASCVVESAGRRGFRLSDQQVRAAHMPLAREDGRGGGGGGRECTAGCADARARLVRRTVGPERKVGGAEPPPHFFRRHAGWAARLSCRWLLCALGCLRVCGSCVRGGGTVRRTPPPPPVLPSPPVFIPPISLGATEREESHLAALLHPPPPRPNPRPLHVDRPFTVPARGNRTWMAARWSAT